VQLKAAGFLQITLGGVVGFRIEGSLLVSVSGSGFQVAVDGVLTARVGPTTLLRLNASGGLKITNQGSSSVPDFRIAGKLSLSLAARRVLNGSGFAFSATLTLELNTTNQAQDLNGDGTTDLVAGIYARVHADGTLALQTSAGTTGLFLVGTFDLAVGTVGFSLAANAKLEAPVNNERM